MLLSNGSPRTVTVDEQRASSTLLTEMSLRLLTIAAAAAAACEHYRDALVVGVYVVFACISVATQVEFEDALPAGCVLFIRVAAMGIFLLNEYPMRVRMAAFLTVSVAGISAAVGFGLAVGCISGDDASVGAGHFYAADSACRAAASRGVSAAQEQGRRAGAENTTPSTSTVPI